jgi:hypothetical protein
MTANDKAQVTVMTALAMAVLLGLVAFATDIGLFLIAKRQMQTAADSAAMAGAAEINYNDVVSAARADSAQNGFTNGSNGVTVAVNSPPSSGSHKGGSNAGYVEVIVSQSQPTIFMKILSRGAMVVSARAVATVVPSSNCIYALGRSGTDIDQTGSGNFTVSNCSILDDSSDPTAALKRTGSGSISAQAIGIVGNYHQTGSGSISPTPTTGMTAVSDPLSLTAPSYVPSSCNAAFNHSGSTSVTIPGPAVPGGTICYDGISNTGSGTITFPTGTYVINGNFSNSGSAGLSGTTGVTFYMAPGNNTLSISGSGTINLAAPNAGVYSGILFYQDSGDTKTISISGSSSGTFSGIFYAPTAELDLTGSSGASFNTDLVVSSLTITGSVNLSDYVPLAGASPLSSPTLVE